MMTEKGVSKMISKSLSVFGAFCLAFTFANGFCRPVEAQAPAGGAFLIVEVVGFKDPTGNATICLFDSEDSFKSVDMRKDRKDEQKYLRSVQDVQIQRSGNDLTAVCKIDNLQPGEYVAFAFHDCNSNGKVDSNLIGMPVEPIAFSNGLRPQLFPIPKTPSWKACAFSVKPGENRIRLVVQKF
jgi:uncharacterized protein (DUF2141 family)